MPSSYGKMPAMVRRLLIIGLLLSVAFQAQAQGEAGDLLGRINGLRASLGLPAYRLNGALGAAAQSQAQWMADTASISHVRPNGSSPRTRAVNSGYGTTDVSENIYGGTNASVNAAWTFWVNSGIHYRGLTNARYQEVGIGIAGSSWGRTYVLVFGNPGGSPWVPPSANGGGSSAAAAPPSYVLGIDERGFILHEVQPEETLGDIALLYGYTWDDIPYMKDVNELVDHRLLQPGQVFLVPPHDGTYTPTPGGAAPEATAVPDTENDTTDELQATETTAPTMTSSPSPAPTQIAIATAAAMPEMIALAVPSPTVTPQTVAQALVSPVPAGSAITRSSAPSPWLVAALVLQAGLLVVAVFEFVRRARRSKS